MKKYLTHIGAALAVVAASLLAIGCGDKEEAGDEGANTGTGETPAKAAPPTKGPDKAPSKAPDKPADLEAEFVGYWAPNVPKMVEEMKKEIGDDPAAAAMIPMMTAMMGMMTLEFQKGEVTIHGPDGGETATYELKSSDADTKTLTMDVTDPEGNKEEGTARLEGDQLILAKGEDTLVLDRIDEAAFEARKKAAEAAAATGEGIPTPGIPTPGGEEAPPIPPLPTPPTPPDAPTPPTPPN